MLCVHVLLSICGVEKQQALSSADKQWLCFIPSAQRVSWANEPTQPQPQPRTNIKKSKIIVQDTWNFDLSDFETTDQSITRKGNF